jgi:hypothetical protein
VTPTSGTKSATVRVDYSANSTAAARIGGVSFTRPSCSGSNCVSTFTVNQAQPVFYTLHVTSYRASN